MFTSLFVIKIFCAVGIGSLICLLAFTGIGFLYRKELNQRRAVTSLLESHLGESQSRPQNGELEEQEAIAL